MGNGVLLFFIQITQIFLGHHCLLVLGDLVCESLLIRSPKSWAGCGFDQHVGSLGIARTCTAAEARSLAAGFADFPATMARSDFSGPRIIGFGSSPSQCGPPS